MLKRLIAGVNARLSTVADLRFELALANVNNWLIVLAFNWQPGWSLGDDNSGRLHRTVKILTYLLKEGLLIRPRTFESAGSNSLCVTVRPGKSIPSQRSKKDHNGDFYPLNWWATAPDIRISYGRYYEWVGYKSSQIMIIFNSFCFQCHDALWPDQEWYINPNQCGKE